MSLLVPETGLIFWMIISFGLVFFVLAKYGFPIIIKKINERKILIEQSFIDAKAAKSQLENVAKECQDLISCAHGQQAGILKEASILRSQIIENAKEEAIIIEKKEIDSARLEIKKERDAALAQVKTEIVIVAVEVAEKILIEKLSSTSAQVNLINKILDKNTTIKS